MVEKIERTAKPNEILPCYLSRVDINLALEKALDTLELKKALHLVVFVQGVIDSDKDIRDKCYVPLLEYSQGELCENYDVAEGLLKRARAVWEERTADGGKSQSISVLPGDFYGPGHHAKIKVVRGNSFIIASAVHASLDAEHDNFLASLRENIIDGARAHRKEIPQERNWVTLHHSKYTEHLLTSLIKDLFIFPVDLKAKMEELQPGITVADLRGSFIRGLDSVESELNGAEFLRNFSDQELTMIEKILDQYGLKENIIQSYSYS